MATEGKAEKIDPDDIERESVKTGRHWKEILKEQLSIVSSPIPEDVEFLQECKSEGDDSIPIEEVWKATSGIFEPMSDAVIAERNREQ